MAFALLFLTAFAIRAVQFGNPIIHVDDQFYLLVGDRMRSGALPYVDIWDRKPIGLFLIYAAIRALSGEGVLAYQLVATLFAGATACVVFRLACQLAPSGAALASAVLYLLLLMANGGDGGQSPVFYNLLMALAATCTLRAVRRPAGPDGFAAWSLAAMALVGVALQVKYSVLFEGVFFGLALLAAGARQGVAWQRLSLLACGWIAVALLPTAIALLAYALAGHIQAFVFANFISIFQRARSEDGDALARLGRILLHVAPALLPAILALPRAAWRGQEIPERRFLIGWAVCALGAVVAFGTYWDHYALPLLPPLSVLATVAFARPRLGVVVATLSLVFAATLGVVTIGQRISARGRGGEVRAIVAAIGPAAAQGVFVFNGDPIIYLLTGAPLPTPWLFPTMLSERRDRPTLGIDPDAEQDRVMASAPLFVVTRNPDFRQADRAAFARLQRWLDRGYQLAGEWVPGDPRRIVRLYRRVTRTKPYRASAGRKLSLGAPVNTATSSSARAQS